MKELNIRYRAIAVRRRRGELNRCRCAKNGAVRRIGERDGWGRIGCLYGDRPNHKGVLGAKIGEGTGVGKFVREGETCAVQP